MPRIRTNRTRGNKGHALPPTSRSKIDHAAGTAGDPRRTHGTQWDEKDVVVLGQASSHCCSPDDVHVIRELGQVAELKRRGAFPEAFVLYREHSEVALFSNGKLNRLVLAITPSSSYLSDAETLRRLGSRANDATMQRCDSRRGAEEPAESSSGNSSPRKHVALE